MILRYQLSYNLARYSLVGISTVLKRSLFTTSQKSSVVRSGSEIPPAMQNFSGLGRREEPVRQPYAVYSAEDEQWHHVHPNNQDSSGNGELTRFSILSWNIDFRCPVAVPRMTAALKHLQMLVTKSERPCIILLQEMVASDLKLLQQQPWIQSSYFITDINTGAWNSGYYGTTTLIPKSMSISDVFRVYYEHTNMGRDGLFVDIVIENNKILRVCNTHLESLVAKPPLRPKQLHVAARYMHESQVAGSILGGDLNAIEPFDKTMHVDNNLTDSYLATGGEEDSTEGYTWGHMARIRERRQFGLSRMDKLLFCGAILVENFKTFGLGVEVEAEHDRQVLIDDGYEAGWVTDHLGMKGDFYINIKDEEVQNKL